MTDRRFNDLLYGHLGGAVYDPDTRQWVFSRLPNPQRQTWALLRPLSVQGSAQEAFRPLRPSPGFLQSWESSRPDGRRLLGKRLQHETQSLVQSHPQLVPGLDSLVPFATVSEAVTRLTAHNDPIVSDLFAFGKAADLDNQVSGARTVPIVAVAGGKSGETVRLIHVRSQSLAWGFHKGVQLGVPVLGEGEEGCWSGTGAAVQQIRFAETGGEPSAWLAVRSPTSTTILRITYHRVPVPSSSAERGFRHFHPPSRIHANQIVTIPVGSTGITHADVSFNPWYHRQIAIVDQKGNWGVWEIEGQKRKRSLYTAVAGTGGHIYDGLDQDTEKDHLGNADGWAAVLWVGNVKTVVVCNRRHMALFDLDAEPRRLPCPDLSIAKTSNWILGIERSPLKENHFFILTSSHLFWLEVTPFDASIERADAGCKILVSWRHFRHGEDIGLRFSLSCIGQDLLLLLYSRLNKLITVFQFSLETGIGSFPVPISISDPSLLELPLGIVDFSNNRNSGANHEMAKSISSIVMRPAEYVIRQNVASAGPGNFYMDNGVQFHSIFFMCNDLTVSPGLYASRPSVEKPKGRFNIEAPDVLMKALEPKSSTRITEDNFVVGDDEVLLGQRLNGVTAAKHAHRYQGRILRTSARGHLDPWTVPNEKIYDEAFQDIGPAETRADSSTEGFTSYLEKLNSRLLAKLDIGYTSIESLLELNSSRLQIDDVDDASLRLSELLHSLGNHQNEDGNTNTLAFRTLDLNDRPANQATGQGMEAEPHLRDSLTRLYDDLVAKWVSPLPATIPGIVRLSRERAARKIAAEICLASIGASVLPNTPDDINDHPFPDIINPPSLNLARRSQFEGASASQSLSPSRSPSLSSNSKEKQPVLHSSSPPGPLSSQPPPPLPTPTPTPSLHSQTSMSSSHDEAPFTARLRSYTSTPALPPLPRSLSTLISHWTPGMNPETYSWSRTGKAIALASSQQDLDSDHSEVERRKERRKKGKAKKARSSRAESWASSQPGMGPPSIATTTTSTQPNLSRPWMSSPPPPHFASASTSRPNASPAQGTSSQAPHPPNMHSTAGDRDDHPPSSSQPFPMSQAERGKFGTRTSLGTKKKRGSKRPGFR
ncbi:MAG: hypothetical protein M1819_002046 [Sarea resinae]|nr:MAG: hypothetical protein M1819_002046 [Sarea resinae]